MTFYEDTCFPEEPAVGVGRPAQVASCHAGCRAGSGLSGVIQSSASLSISAARCGRPADGALRAKLSGVLYTGRSSSAQGSTLNVLLAVTRLDSGESTCVSKFCRPTQYGTGSPSWGGIEQQTRHEPNLQFWRCCESIGTETGGYVSSTTGI